MGDRTAPLGDAVPALDTTRLGEQLLASTASLVDIESLSLNEHAIANEVESRLRAVPWLAVERLADNVIARTELGRARRVLLAGHLDTVPGSAAAVVSDHRVTGLGAADMKGGLAVLLWLAAELREPAVDLTFVFYAAEEIAQEYSGLAAIQAASPALLAADVAVVAEPTGGLLEAGCQGSLRLRVELGGKRAHTARPWMGENAIHRLAPLLSALAVYEAREPTLDGCHFRESLQAVGIEAGVAGNVVPDTATLLINHRFAPDRSAEEALAVVQGLFTDYLRPGESLTVVDIAEAAPPSLDHPLLAALASVVDTPPRAKLGWTDVARLYGWGVPAVNFGPGHSELAHTPGEWVDAEQLTTAAIALHRFLLLGERARS